MPRDIEPTVVTDHALVRYIERVWNFDLEPFRRAIRDDVKTGIALGAASASVYVNGSTYVLKNNAVVTIVLGRTHNLDAGGAR